MRDPIVGALDPGTESGRVAATVRAAADAFKNLRLLSIKLVSLVRLARRCRTAFAASGRLHAALYTTSFRRDCIQRPVAAGSLHLKCAGAQGEGGWRRNSSGGPTDEDYGAGR